MIIKCIPGGIFLTNCYIIGDEETNEGILIDPGEQIDDILAAVKRSGLKIKMIVNTHTHIDHVAGAVDAMEALGVGFYIHPEEEPVLQSLPESAMRFPQFGEVSVPEIEGIEHVITSDGFFELKDQPREVAIIGAGYIACELAGVFQALGSQVHLVYRGELPLRGFDCDLRRELDSALRASLTTWAGNHAKLEPVLAASPKAREARGLSRDLSAAAAVGLEALDAVRAGRAPAAAWTESANQVLDRAAKPRIELELHVVPGLRKLVLAATRIEEAAAMPLEEWNRKLDEQLKPAARPADEH